MNTYPKTKIDPNITIDIYKTMKREPLKTYGKRDFNHSYLALENSFNFLRRLNIVEQVPYIYMSGNKMIKKREIKGYRLL
jgi:hypothetical protein